MSNNTVCRQATLLPTVLGVMLFSIQSVLSVESISVVQQSLYICSKLFILKNYMRWRTRGLSLCISAKTQNINIYD